MAIEVIILLLNACVWLSKLACLQYLNPSRRFSYCRVGLDELYLMPLNKHILHLFFLHGRVFVVQLLYCKHVIWSSLKPVFFVNEETCTSVSSSIKVRS